ncbi:hypothetical protein CsatA_009011 [Cannabis sativa]
MAALSVSMTIHVTTIIMFFMFLAKVALMGNVFGNGVGESNILCHETEKQALLSFKKDLVDDYNKLVSWNVSEEEDCCKWAGISCNALTGHVSKLSLRDGSLTGKINPSLLNLTHLANLDLSLNNFGGIQIPSFVGSFVSLRYLNLTYGHFKGMIPQQLGNLSSLLYLGLGHNLDLYVDNLHWVSSLSSLESLDLSYVDLSKAYDHWLLAINMIPSLQELHLSYCYLSHIHFPSHINLTSLETLDLSHNSLELGGSIPCLFRNNMSLLKYLDLSGNNIDSVIPNCLFSFPNLEHLHLSNTKLHGVISSDVTNLTSIVSLNLRSNALAGKIPSSMGKLCNLKEFDLGGNNYKGSVSMVFESLSGRLSKSLKSLNLGRNFFDSFGGQLVDKIKDFENLDDFSLQSNKFSGPIPIPIFKNIISLKSLDLSYNNFSGPLPESLDSLSKLESFYISNNHFNGPLPKSLGSLSQLQTLIIYRNHFSGLLPESLGSLSQLQTLMISNNHFSGLLPKTLGSLSNLEYLSIESNSFEGNVCEFHFANLKKLKHIFASENNLSFKVSLDWTPPFSLGTIEIRNWNLGPHFPTWLKSQKDIFRIDMSNTGISDVIPSWLWNFSSADIDMSRNQIYGEIPNFPNDGYYMLNLSYNKLTGPLPHIPVRSMLDLSNNYLSGNISNFLCDPKSSKSNVMALYLENNLLSGKIPDCWMYWPSLNLINLDNNNLSGKIPSSVGSLLNLMSLHLQNNSLSGEIPKTMKNCSALKGLYLGFNKLVGTIPRWIESLPTLRFLVLRSNNFTGHIPNELCKLSMLQVLDASDNSLTGKIPKCFNNLTAMSSKSQNNPFQYYLGVNNQRSRENANVVIKGRENQYNTILYLLSTFDLSSNKLSGEIPEQLTSLDALQSLNLSGNYLSGSIPKKIDSMTYLESLDLSRNHLSGHIPTSLSSLSFLSHLNLSYNNLSGKIPIGTQLQSMDASSFMGNKLCGPPLLKKCIEDPNTTHSNASNEDGQREDDEYWFRLGIGMGFGVSFLGVIVPLVVCGFWRRAYFWFFEEYLWNKFVDYFIKIKYMF